MSADIRPQSDAANPRRRFQFSLRIILLVFLALSIPLAIAAQYPRWSFRTAGFTWLMLFPLTVAALLRASVARLGLIHTEQQLQSPGGRRTQLLNKLRRPIYFLGLWQPDAGPSLAAGITIALTSMLTLVGLWPALREIGLMFSVASIQTLDQTWDYAVRVVPDTLVRTDYWQRLWQWELWSSGRWWLLFGTLALFWLIVSAVLRPWFKSDPPVRMLARLLAFAPWIMVLEISFLIGVWMMSANTVPEPSTGFVVGIFSWDLWHWDCWRDRGWMIRGAAPTLVSGLVFFTNVLRWRWPFAVVVSLALVPIALMLSVACTVAYQNGFPH